METRTLHFIWSANFGGIEKVVIDLCRAQASAGAVKPTLLIGCRKGSFLEHISESNIDHLFAGFKKGTDFRPAMFRKLRKLMKEFDIIHLHTFNPLVALAAATCGRPVVYTIHGNFNFGRKKRVNDRINQMLRKWFFNKCVDHITFNSLFTKATATNRYGLRHIASTVIHNGIPLHVARMAEPVSEQSHLDKLKGKFVVGTSSRFAGFKRIDRLLEAFSIFATGKDDVLLVMVGDGVLRNRLEAHARADGINDKTLFTGFQKNVSSYQAAMDVCVFPSQNEPFGLVAVETLALGKPTLAFADAGGMLEILQPELADDIVDNIQALANRLNQYYTNRLQPDHTTINLRKSIAGRYDISGMESKIRTVYNALLHR